VERFVEKPIYETAVQMLASGEYSWNSGMFIWTVDAILAEFQKQMPTFHAQLAELATVLNTPVYEPTLERVWPQVKKETIDYGVMENARQVAVLPVDIGWSDVGSWASLFELLPVDANANVWTGPHIDIATLGTLVFSDTQRLVATIGLENLVIVDTQDALLVCTRDREQEVREVVARLKVSGDKQWL
jgi:mannose-1-phosphate guanylyltransferase